MWTKCSTMIVAVLAVCSMACVSLADIDAVQGVFGVKDYGEDTALALWVTLESTESVAGIRWFNNDSEASFGEILAVAGVHGELGQLEDAISVGIDVSGADSGWSEYVFERPLASSTMGFYLFFRMPKDNPFSHAGFEGGAGLGYCVGDGILRSWLTGDGENWDPIGTEFMMAVEPLYSAAKSSFTNESVLVLGTSKDQTGDSETTTPMLSQGGLHIYPNPFNPMTEIKFQLAASAAVELTVFDVRGMAVKHLVHEVRGAGEHVVVWDGRSDNDQSLPSGVYLAQVKSREGTATARMTLVQ